MALTGNGASVVIYTDGDGILGGDPSVAGNQLSGTFKLALRGWETEVKGNQIQRALYSQNITCLTPVLGIAQLEPQSTKKNHGLV